MPMRPLFRQRRAGPLSYSRCVPITFARSCALRVRLLSSVAALALGAMPLQAAATASGTVPMDAATALLLKALQPLLPPAARVEIVPGTLDPRLQLAPCARIEPFLPGAARPWGRTRLGLRCIDGPTAWTAYLPITVKVLAPGIVLRAPRPAGSVLQAEDLAMAEVDWAAAASAVLAQPEMALGRSLARPLAAGEALRVADLRARRWFAAGDTVRLVAVGSGFAVAGDGQALGDGIEGQTVRVRTESGRVLSGRATGERRVELSL